MSRPLYRTPAEGLRAITDPVAFERVAYYLLRRDYPELELTAPSKDDGIDMYSRRLGSRRDDVRGMVSLQASWTNKLDAELDTIEQLPAGDRPKVAVFVTVKNAQEAHIRPRRERAAALGVDLLVFGFTQLLTRLEDPDFRWVAELDLGVEPLKPKTLLGADRFSEMTAGLVPGFEADLVGREAELAAVREALWSDGADAPRLVMVEGPGGIGKTRVAVEASRDFTTLVAPTASAISTDAIDGIPGDTRAVLIVDDAHRCLDLSGVTALLHDRPFAQTKVILVIRPGMAGEVLTRAGLERFAATTVDVGPLPREAMATVIREAGIRDDAFTTQVIDLARGVPLIAHAMCETALAKGRFDGRDVVDVFNAKMAVRLNQDDQAGRAVASALALASSARTAEDIDVFRGTVSGLPTSEEIPRYLERLTDLGLAQAAETVDALGGVEYTYSIKPDLFASTVVASGLGTGRGVKVDFDRCLTAIGLGSHAVRGSEAPTSSPRRVTRSRSTLAHLDRAPVTHQVALLAHAAAIAERPALTDLLVARIFELIPREPSAGDWVVVFRLAEQVVPYAPEVFTRLQTELARRWPPTIHAEVFWFETLREVSDYHLTQMSSAAFGLAGRHGQTEPTAATSFALTTALLLDEQLGVRSREDLGRAVAAMACPGEHENWSRFWQRRTQVLDAISAWVDKESSTQQGTDPHTRAELRRVSQVARVALTPLLDPVVERFRKGSPEAADVIVMTGGHLPAGPETTASVATAARLVAQLIERFPVDDLGDLPAGDDPLRGFTTLPWDMWATGARGAPRGGGPLPRLLRDALASGASDIESAFAARWPELPLWARFEVLASVLRVRPARSLKQRARQGSPVAGAAAGDEELAAFMTLVPPRDDPQPVGTTAEDHARAAATKDRRVARQAAAAQKLAKSVTVAEAVRLLRVLARTKYPWTEHDPAQDFARAVATLVTDAEDAVSLLDAAFSETPPAHSAILLSTLIENHTDLVATRLTEHARSVRTVRAVLDAIDRLPDPGLQRILVELTLETIVDTTVTGMAGTGDDHGTSHPRGPLRDLGTTLAGASGVALAKVTSLAPAAVRASAVGGLTRIARGLTRVPDIAGLLGGIRGSERPPDADLDDQSRAGTGDATAGDAGLSDERARQEQLTAAADAWVLTTYRVGIASTSDATDPGGAPAGDETGGSSTVWHLDALIRMGLEGPPSAIGDVLQRATQQARHAPRTRLTRQELGLSADHLTGLLAVLNRALEVDDRADLIGFVEGWNYAAAIVALARIAPDELASTLTPWLLRPDGRSRRWPHDWERALREMDVTDRLPFGEALKTRLDPLMEATPFGDPSLREEAQFYLDRDIEILFRDSTLWEGLVAAWIDGPALGHVRAAAVLAKSWRSPLWPKLVNRLLAARPEGDVVDRLIDGMIPMGFGPDIAEDIGVRLEAIGTVNIHGPGGSGFVDAATRKLQQVVYDYEEEARRSRAGY